MFEHLEYNEYMYVYLQVCCQYSKFCVFNSRLIIKRLFCKQLLKQVMSINIVNVCAQLATDSLTPHPPPQYGCML